MGVRRYRRGLLAAMVLTVCLGLASKLENAGAWANYYGGDIVYEMFWIYGLGWLKPSWRAGAIAAGVFCVTGAIEVFQLVPFPESLQAQLWWRLLLGTSFSWLDFPHYFLGCILGGLSLRWWQFRSGLDRATFPCS